MAVTYDEIKSANASITMTDIKGNPYATVAQRVNAFRQVYPTGYIITTKEYEENGICVFRAEVGYIEYTEMLDGSLEKNNVTLATGTAREKEGSSFINNLSHLENCETSAVGRALGFAGFGVDKDIASADEVANAQINDVSKEKIDDMKVKTLTARCKKSNVNVEDLCKLYKVKSLADLTMKKFMDIHENWEKIALGNGEAGE